MMNNLQAALDHGEIFIDRRFEKLILEMRLQQIDEEKSKG